MGTDVLARPPARTAVWVPDGRPAVFRGDQITACAARIREPLHLVAAGSGHGVGVGVGGTVTDGSVDGHRLLGLLPALYPEWLGDRSFNEAHGVRFPYVAGEMAGGIATTSMVIAMARADMLGFFGAGGLPVARVEQAVAELKAALPGRVNWGVNLIHSPAEPATEDAVAALLLAAGVPAVSASAFMELTPAVVRLAAHGLTRDASGRVRRRTRLFAKVSRPEVAEQFMRPAPAPLVRALVERGHLTEAEAELAASVPVAEDITVEADSGGHTDNRALTVVMPIILALRARLAEDHGYDRPIRVGAAGGLGTPGAVAAAFALGAAYVVTGSVNQASVESGMSEDGKAMLSEAGMADVVMAPAADMFELGVRLQVLRRGTMFAFRAAQLHQVYSAHGSWDEVPERTRAKIERTQLKASYADVWARSRAFWLERDPEQVARAERDPRHQMALVFRWYLGMSSRWAVRSDSARRTDYQIWCGPAMGAFNDWARGTFLAEPAGRSVVQIARNLLEGAAVITRAQQLRTHGVAVPHAAFAFEPRPLDQGPFQ
ncbi:PfaD family polyunsaturated fatty acid/polyketide biosynthesis protein [Spirillospora sp. CA-294931]|uniref:PfaD family polyunsaturated fatty acid/polyketide biosynthesis protein n=1 Tax=Spirillospora sp. CA-294931 TaxID=3240042 RepID=UPI003D8D71EA